MGEHEFKLTIGIFDTRIVYTRRMNYCNLTKRIMNKQSTRNFASVHAIRRSNNEIKS